MTIADVLFLCVTLHPYLTALVAIVVVAAPFSLVGQAIARRGDEATWEAAAKAWGETAKEAAKVAEELRKLRDR